MTAEKLLSLTDSDHVRLREMIQSLADVVGNPFAGHLRGLEQEIAGAEVVPSRRVPPDVVTMNSHVRLRDVDSGVTECITLVYHGDADLLSSRLSVLAPLGVELLGRRAGDVIEWRVAGGVRRLLIERVLYQPEAAGHFHL
jgi:regulator of nucleoside diphosphate kinase